MSGRFNDPFDEFPPQLPRIDPDPAPDPDPDPVSPVQIPGELPPKDRGTKPGRVIRQLTASYPHRSNSGRDINSLGQNVTPERQAHPSGVEGDPIALLYGYGPHGGTLMFRGIRSDGVLVIAMLWGQGPVEEFVRFEMNGVELPSSVLREHYRGDPADSNYGDVSPLCVSAESTYADTLVDTDAETGATIHACYSVFGVPPHTSESWPEFRAWIRGHRLYDDRDAGQDPDDESTWVYSANAALVQADAYSHPTRGLGLLIDWASTQTAADDCETIRARECNLRLQDRQEAPVVITVLGEYARCEIDADGATGRQYPLKNETPVAALDRNDCVGHNFTGSSKRGQDRPDVIIVNYTHVDPDNPYRWTTKHVKAVRPGLVGNAQPYAVQRLAMPGYHDRSMTYRYAVDRINELRGDIIVSWSGADSGLKYVRGDVVTITDGNGLAAFRVRIDRIQVQSFGGYRFEAREDSPAMYSAEPAPDEPNIDPGLPGVFNPVPPAVVNIVEEIYQTRGGRWANRLCVKWDLSAYLYPHEYFSQVLAADDSVLWSSPAISSDARVFRTGPVQEGVAYTARVQTATRLFRGEWGVSDSYTAQGKLLVPGTPPNFQAWSVNGELFASWDEGADSDVERYRLTYAQITGGSPDPQPSSGLFLGLEDTYEFRSARPAVGLWRVWCYAVDSVGQLSATPASADVTITQSNDAYLLSSVEITHDDTEGSSLGKLPVDRGQTTFEYFVEEGESVTDIFTGSDVGGDYPNPIASYRIATFPWEPANLSFDVGLGGWSFLGASHDTGGDGGRAKIVGSGLAGYIQQGSPLPWLIKDAYFRLSCIVHEESGAPSFVGTYESAPGVWSAAPLQIKQDLGDGTYRLSAVWQQPDPEPLGASGIGFRVQATDGSFVIIDDVLLERDVNWISDELDVGADASGCWSLSYAVDVLGGTPSVEIQTRIDGSSEWTSHGQTSVNATARYARMRVSATGGQTTAFLLKDPIGSIYVDVSTRRRQGTITSLTSGAWDYQADGAHEASAASLFDFTGSMTMAVRFRADVLGSATARLLWGKKEDVGAGVLYLGQGGTDIAPVIWRFGSGSGTYFHLTSAVILIPGETYTAVVCRDAIQGVCRLWVDGVPQSDALRYGLTPASDTVTKMALGGENWGANYDGMISRATVWDAALTDDEIRDYSYGVSTRATNLYADYQFGGTGMSLTDSSGNGRTLSASTGLGSTDDHVTVGVPAWELLSEQFSAVKSFTFTPFSEEPASFGVPKIQLLADRFAFGVLARDDGSPVEQSALYTLEAV